MAKEPRTQMSGKEALRLVLGYQAYKKYSFL